MENNYQLPVPIVDRKESNNLDSLTSKYEKLIKPGTLAKIGGKVSSIIPKKAKDITKTLGDTITEQKLYEEIMGVVASGFKAIEEQASKFTISEKQIVDKINKISDTKIQSIDDICLVRSYNIAKAVNSFRSQNTFYSVIEGGGTGALGFWGLPANIALSTFSYFRAVQSIAMFYGYDIKNDYAEMVIASEVFTSALSPTTNDLNNEATNIISKIMVMGQASTLKQVSKKTWTDMASHKGIPLLLTQLRALANKSAKKALDNVGQKGIENSVFKEALEQIGRKLTLKNIGKAVPVASAILGALIDTSQMKKILEFADIFYHKRFIVEKEERIGILTGENPIVIDTDIIDIEDKN